MQSPLGMEGGVLTSMAAGRQWRHTSYCPQAGAFLRDSGVLVGVTLV
jgi:hypothetical protein